MQNRIVFHLKIREPDFLPPLKHFGHSVEWEIDRLAIFFPYFVKVAKDRDRKILFCRVRVSHFLMSHHETSKNVEAKLGFFIKREFSD